MEIDVERARTPAKAGCLEAKVPAGLRRRAARRAAVSSTARATNDLSTPPSGTAR